MSILYRRFILVTALIATFGVLTANLILETRRGPVAIDAFSPSISAPCQNQLHCALFPISRISVSQLARG